MDTKRVRTRVGGGIGADTGFWDALEDGELKLMKCGGCAKWIWPANYRCAACGSWDMRWEKIEPIGRIYAWTRVWIPSDRIMERAQDLPYVTVLAELPAAAGARVFGILKGNEEGLRIGAPVHGEVDPPSEKTKDHATLRWIIG